MNTEKMFTQKFFTGVNYWGLKHATEMWEKFDAASIEEDIRALSECGVTYLRVFPMWHVFQPLKALYTTSLTPFEYRFGEEPLPDTPAGRAGVSEEACRNFETFCDIVEKYNLKMVVGLITGHMSFREFAPPAFAGKHRLSDPTVLKWQLRYVRYFVNRFKNRAAIAGWDLGNEVNNMARGEGFLSEDDFYVWCSAISDAIRANDPDHPVVSGMDTTVINRTGASMETIRDTCDIHTCHPYNIFATGDEPLPTMEPVLDLVYRCRMGEDIAHVPTFVQEFGSIGYLNCSQKTEADFYRACLYASLAHGCHGVMWWCAYDQGHLRIAPYDWNNIGSDYGFMDKNRNPKPIVAENLAFCRLLDKLPNGTLPSCQKDAVIIVPRDNGDAADDRLRSALVLAKRANLDVRFSYALETLPDAPIYILSSLSSNQSITATRLDELLEKVYEGAVFYLSIGNSLFRRIAEITGVQTAWRQVTPTEKTITLDGEKFTLTVPVDYHIESADAEILASDQNGTPVFFRRQYGKGYVFFMMAPVEDALAKRPGCFWKKDEPRYDLIYRKLAEAAGIRRRVDTDSPFVRATEHPIDENSAYIVFVNYSMEPVSARISVYGGKLVPIHNAELTDDNMLYLKENDGAVFLYQKTETGIR